VEHALTGESLDNLAEFYREQGRGAEAEPLLRHALVLAEASLGQGHPLTATRLESLARLFRAQGRAGEADELSRRAQAIRAKGGSAGPPR